MAAEAIELIEQAGIPITNSERTRLSVNDLGLDNPRVEGFQYFDLLLTPMVRVSLLALLPNQTLPEHRHPAYDGSPGKEESVRAVTGELRVYIPGPDTLNAGFIVPGKEDYYTVRNEVVLAPGQGLTVEPRVAHWFQTGPAGAVFFTFQNRVDESLNTFTDPGVTRSCGVELAQAARQTEGTLS